MASVSPSPTPNPNAMKFTLDVKLPATINFANAAAAEGNPFAAAVFKTPGVASVFGVNDFITVSRTSKELRFYRGLELEKSYRVAIGRAGFETPTGLYHIQNKAVDVAWNVPEWGGKLAGQTIPGGSPKNPLKARWLGIYDAAGIHGTDDIASLGTAASHGCIRMAIPEVIELYDKVPVQTPIYIA